MHDDEENSDHESTVEHVHNGGSLRRQPALLSESDSLDSSDQSFGTVLPTQSLSFVSPESISRYTNDSELTRVYSPSMASSDSGRDTKSCTTGDWLQQDLEDLSVISDNFDSDDAFCSNNELLGFNSSQKELMSVDDEIDVEKSLSPLALRKLRPSPSILHEKLQVYYYNYVYSVLKFDLLHCTYVCICILLLLLLMLVGLGVERMHPVCVS